MMAAVVLLLMGSGAATLPPTVPPAVAVPAPRVEAVRTKDGDAARHAPLAGARIDARALTAPSAGAAVVDDPASDLATLQAVVDRLYPPGKPEARARDSSEFLLELP